MASETYYVNKPGGIVATLASGEKKHLKYGDVVPKLADHVNHKRFSDTTKRKPDPLPEVDAAERLRQNLKVESGATTAIPSNYNQLEPEEVVSLIKDASDEDAAQILLHEMATGARQLIVDAAPESARNAVYEALQGAAVVEQHDNTPADGGKSEDEEPTKDGYPDNFDKLKAILETRDPSVKEGIQGQPSKAKVLAAILADDNKRESDGSGGSTVPGNGDQQGPGTPATSAPATPPPA